MLTASEQEWLEQRDPKLYCRWCTGGNDDVWCDYALATDVCPLYEDKDSLWDAAEFSERVAAKLADAYWPPMDVGSDGPRLFMPPADRLKWARLAVEEEMNADSK